MRKCFCRLVAVIFLLSLPNVVLASEFRGADIVRKVEDLFLRWRYGSRGLGIDISPVEEREWESLRREAIFYRKEVEYAAKNDGDWTFLLDEYLIASEGVLSFFAAIAPGQLESVNQELALTTAEFCVCFSPNIKRDKKQGSHPSRF